MGKNRQRRRALGLLPDPARCVARKRDGTPCRAVPVSGAAVCRMHGGSAPQVKRKAAERIAHASDVAVMKLLALMQDPDVPKAVQAAVARDLLDRANVSGKTTVELEVKPWEKLLDGIIVELPAGDVVPGMRPFAEAQDEEALRVDSERFDAETLEVERAETAQVLESYREERQDRSRSRPPTEPATPAHSQPRDGNPPPPRHGGSATPKPSGCGEWRSFPTTRSTRRPTARTTADPPRDRPAGAAWPGAADAEPGVSASAGRLRRVEARKP